jgi:deazaflavin-dependent oxidoreductase (nitroreductase family)
MDSTSMNDWNQQITNEFRANEGRVGGVFEGARMILIHHIGAKSGTERVTPLVYFPEDDGTMVIVASKAGAPTNPDWYHNLRANPEVTVETGFFAYPATAQVLHGSERDELFARLSEAEPGWAGYQSRTTRTIPSSP